MEPHLAGAHQPVNMGLGDPLEQIEKKVVQTLTITLFGHNDALYTSSSRRRHKRW